MNKDVVIRAEHVSKLYKLGMIGTGTIAEDLSRFWSRIVGKKEPHTTVNSEDTEENIWALKDVNFEVKQGEVLGIIGKNGAGKSTLLKILSQITQPTSGEIRIKGRIASLLEVGTGFHGELSGRQNIFLNGAILGMRKEEIRNKFDEIVDFSGVGKFIDTPVKRYSSGMYVRLAFAVAAHLEPEILIIDEVLAVGDVEFQKKCLGKMNDVSKNDGRTVLFVSHQMAAVQNLCTSCIYLSQGKIKMIGETQDVIGKYLLASSELSKISLKDRTDREGNGILRIIDVIYKNKSGQEVRSYASGQDAFLCFKYTCRKAKADQILIAIGFNDRDGVRILNMNNEQSGNTLNIDSSDGYLVCEIPQLPLVKGLYYVTIFVSIQGEISDWIQDAFTLSVEDGDFFGTGRIQFSGQGKILVKNKWFVAEN